MNDQKKKICAVVLSAGRGRRMESAVQKQYMCLNGKPMIAHTLAAFERSCVDEIILVAGAGEEEYCRKRDRGGRRLSEGKNSGNGRKRTV